MDRKVINPWTWQDALGFVQANEVTGAQRVLICSGQTSMDAQGHPVYPGDMRAQMVLALDNLETVLKQAGFKLSDVVRLNAYVTDIEAFFGAWEAVAPRLAEAGVRQASTLLGVTGLAFPELMVELEATAVA